MKLPLALLVFSAVLITPDLSRAGLFDSVTSAIGKAESVSGTAKTAADATQAPVDAAAKVTGNSGNLRNVRSIKSNVVGVKQDVDHTTGTGTSTTPQNTRAPASTPATN